MARALSPSRIPAALLPEREQLTRAGARGNEQEHLAAPAARALEAVHRNRMPTLDDERRADLQTEPGEDLPGDRVQTHETATHSAQSAQPPVPSSPLAAPRLPGATQAKLVVGQINDPLEHEADHVADEIMRVPEPPITAAPPQISRKCASCEEDEKPQTLQTNRAASGASAGEAPRMVHEVLQSPGRPLEASERGFMEPRFGHDLGDVRIHTEASASRSTEALAARAYTVGRDVVLRHGEYAANTTEGRRLLAHELAHVLQQRQTSRLIPGASQSIRAGALTTRVQRQAAATEPMSPADLDNEYQTAVQAGDWQAAAEWLNAFNYEDIQARLAPLMQEQVTNLHQGAASNPRVGPQSQVAQLTEPVTPPASFPPPAASTAPPAASTAPPADSTAPPPSAGLAKEAAEPVQRSWLDDALAWVSSAADDLGKDVDSAKHALELADTAVANPVQIPALLIKVEWDTLPAPIKALVVNRLLDACAELVEGIPAAMDPLVPSGLAISPLVVSAATGFLSRARSFDDATKIKVVDRFVSLWANPSPEFTLGFLKGLVLGLWDGIAGPFELLWDLVKLGWGLVKAEARVVATLADTDRRKQLFADIEGSWNSLAPQVEQAINTLLASQADPAAFLGLLDQLAQALLAGAASLGSGLADSLAAYIMEPDAQLGESVGRVEGNVLFQALLIVLSAGGWAALSAAIEGIEWIADALEALQNAGRAIEGLAAASEALAKFSAFLRESKVLSQFVDVLESAFSLLIRYLKFSYGIEGAEGELEKAATGAGKAAETGLEEGVLAVRELADIPGGHVLKLVKGGRLFLCSWPCEEIAAKFAQELAEPGNAALNDTLATIDRELEAAAAREDGAAQQALFDKAVQVAEDLQDARINALVAKTGLARAQIADLLNRAGGNRAVLEDLLTLATNDPGRVEPLLDLAAGAGDPNALERLHEAAGLFDRQPGNLPGVYRDPALRPYTEANMDHFLDEHTFDFFDFQKVGGSGMSMWPPGTTAGDIEASLADACAKLREPGATQPGFYRPVEVALDTGVVVRIGVMGTPPVIRQFYPFAGPGIRYYASDELRAIGRLLGR